MRTLLQTARLALVSLVVAAPFSSTSQGQPLCFGDDNLDQGQCWQPIQANLPPFPGVSLPGLGVCWKDCTPNQKQEVKVEFSAPQMISCGQYTSDVRVWDSVTGAMVLVGKAKLDYTRTWAEVGNNIQYQIWRFVAKVDMKTLTTVGAANCFLPLANYPQNFFYGYVDYAARCTGPLVFESALALWTGCDFLAHKPGLADFPGAALPNLSFAVVAPHTPATSFVPMNLPAPGGPIVNGAVRNVTNPVGLCTVEERVMQGGLNPLITACLCPLTPAFPQQTLSVFNGIGSCPDATGQPSRFNSQAIAFPTLPWPHMVQTSLGCWMGAAGAPMSYPGPECVWVDEGLFRYHDSCTVGETFEVFYGATTAQGFPVISPIPGPATTFHDLADNYSAPLAGPHPLPLFGSIRPTEHVIYVNTP